MRSSWLWLVGLALLSIALVSCDQPNEATPTRMTVTELAATAVTVDETAAVDFQDWTDYRNDAQQWSVSYPSDWVIQRETHQSIVLVPEAEVEWEPATPAEIPENPRVTIRVGELILEHLGPANFPETVAPDSIGRWLETRVGRGEARDLSTGTRGGFPAFTVVEVGLPGCEKVVYWRPVDLPSLVRISTGCASPYLEQFDQIANSLTPLE